MERKTRNLLTFLVAAAFLFLGAVVQAAQPVGHDAWGKDVLENGTWAEVSAWLKETKDAVELGDASIITESCFETEEE